MAQQAQPLMPHATAAWLVDNSSLTFEQIAEFCGLHILEVQAIADDTAATKLTGRDPIRAGELTHDEIEKGHRHVGAASLKFHMPAMGAMPEMKGIQLTRKLKRLNAGIEVILCTGYSDQITEEKAKQAGAAMFLNKPVAPEIVAQAIRHSIARKRPAER